MSKPNTSGKYDKRKPEEAVLPNSLVANIGKLGYDADGVKAIIQREDGSYSLIETWRTYKLWITENCPLIAGQMRGPDFTYERYDVQAMFAAIDQTQYEENRAYRTLKDLELRECTNLRPRVAEQELRAYAKLWSLCDEALVAQMRRDDDFIFVTEEQQLPGPLRILIIESAAVAVGGGQAELGKEALRTEWTYWAMQRRYTKPNEYAVSFNDFVDRSAAAGLLYTDLEKANKFIQGLSDIWVNFKILAANLEGETKLDTADKAYKRLIEWEVSQVNQFGRVSAHPSVKNYSSYAVRRDQWGRRREESEHDDDDEKPTDIRPRAGVGKFNCHTCGGEGHKSFQCPSNPDRRDKKPAAVEKGKDKEKERPKTKKNCVVKRVMRVQYQTSPTDILLDSGAEVSIFSNRSLLTDIRFATEPSMVSGFGDGQPTSIEEVGKFCELQVLVSDACDMNLLAEEECRKAFDLFPVERWGTRLVHRQTGAQFDFLYGEGGTQVCDTQRPVAMGDIEFLELFEEHNHRKVEQAKAMFMDKRYRVCAVTVEDRKRLYSKKEIEKAELANQFIRNTGSRGIATLGVSLTQMTNVPITNADLRAAEHIFGKQAALKGRSRDKKEVMPPREIPKPLVRTDVKLQADIMDLLGDLSLVAVVRPSAMGLLEHVSSANEVVLTRCVENMVRTCKGWKMDVNEIVVDPQPSLAAAARNVCEMGATVVGTGDHVDDAEALIQVCKNISRCSIHSLPYVMPPSFRKPCAKYSVRRRNSVVNSATGRIPIEDVTGVKVDFREFAIGFGDKVEAYVRPTKTSSMRERTRTAVALYPVGKLGAWRVKFLDTWTEGTSNRVTLIPMDADFVRFMTEQAMLEKPSSAYLHAFKLLQKDGEFDRDNFIAGPTTAIAAPIVAILDDDDDDVPELVDAPDDESDDEGDVAAVPLTIGGGSGSHDDFVAEADVADEAPTDAHVVSDIIVVDDTNVRVMRSGARQARVWVTRKRDGRTRQFVAAVKKGASRTTLTKALKQKGEKGRLAMEATIAELRQIDDKGGWTPVHRSSLTSEEIKGIVRSFIFLTNKVTPDGELIKIKSRLVAMGNMQCLSDSIVDSSAPTVDISSVLTIAAINAREKRHVMTLDVGGAFIHTVWPKDKLGKQVVHLDTISVRY